MVEQIKWMQRKFDFNQVPGVFPNLLERMLGTPLRLEDITAGVSDDILSYKPGGKWSIKENIGHLADIESLHETRLDEILDGKENLTAADMTNKATIEANHNAKPIGEILSRFRNIREAFVKKLDSLDEETIQRAAHHPRLNQPMRIIDIAFFTAEHDDQHMVTIRRIIKSQIK